MNLISDKICEYDMDIILLVLMLLKIIFFIKKHSHLVAEVGSAKCVGKFKSQFIFHLQKCRWNFNFFLNGYDHMKISPKSIENISNEILFFASGKKLQMFEDKTLHQKPKNCLDSTLINICENELIFCVNHEIYH